MGRMKDLCIDLHNAESVYWCYGEYHNDRNAGAIVRQTRDRYGSCDLTCVPYSSTRPEAAWMAHLTTRVQIRKVGPTGYGPTPEATIKHLAELLGVKTND